IKKYALSLESRRFRTPRRKKIEDQLATIVEGPIDLRTRSAKTRQTGVSQKSK
ncbi:hypothetical protein WUBG_10312, partial [Wuchereria bancrofti]